MRAGPISVLAGGTWNAGLVHSLLFLALLPLGTANAPAGALGFSADFEALTRLSAFAPAPPILPVELVLADRVES